MWQHIQQVNRSSDRYSSRGCLKLRSATVARANTTRPWAGCLFARLYIAGIEVMSKATYENAGRLCASAALVIPCEAAWPGCGRLLLPGPLHLLRATRRPVPRHSPPDPRRPPALAPRPGHAVRLSPEHATPHPLTNITGLSLCNVLNLPRPGRYQSLLLKSKTL